MKLTTLIEALAAPAAYPFPVDMVGVHHTHISVVFLAGAFAYKIKKPVALGFVDFSTLKRRHFFCEQEVRLNRRLAPTVYLGVVPITRDADGLHLEGQGEVVEWAVKMARLPVDACLEQRLLKGEIDERTMINLAARVASFHAHAEARAEIAQAGRFAVVAQNVRDNFNQSRAHIGSTVRPEVHARLQRLSEDWLARLQPLLERRAQTGRIRDTHGDLRLEHVYLFPDQPPPGDLVIIDCIEFNESFRHADPIADMAFLVMDLRFHGQSSLANTLAESYFQKSTDEEGRALLPFYVAYRAAVRAKVEGIECEETEVPAEDKEHLQTRARAHWLLALGELEQPCKKPCLILVGGLPGSGKSTLAHALAQNAGLVVIRSDLVRKELFPGNAGARHENKYTPAAARAVYKECLLGAENLLLEGKRVLVDASFHKNDMRQNFLAAAQRLAVPAMLLVCQADPEIISQRLAQRRGDVSDADWAVYVAMAAAWEPVSADIVPTYLFTDQTASLVVARAVQALTAFGIYG